MPLMPPPGGVMPGQMPPPAGLAPGQVPPPPPGPLPTGIAPNTLGRPGVMMAPNMMLPQMPRPAPGINGSVSVEGMVGRVK